MNVASFYFREHVAQADRGFAYTGF